MRLTVLGALLLLFFVCVWEWGECLCVYAHYMCVMCVCYMWKAYIVRCVYVVYMEYVCSEVCVCIMYMRCVWCILCTWCLCM